MLPGPRIRQLGPVLAIEAVTAEDGGIYRCTASNAGGEASAELRLMVSTTVHVEVTPPLLSIHMGGSAEFRYINLFTNYLFTENILHRFMRYLLRNISA